MTTTVTNFGTFSILDHLDRLNILKETATDYHCACPLCDAGGFKIDKKTAKYNTFVCGCMDTDEGKKAVVKAIAPFEPSYSQSPRRQINPKVKTLSLPTIEEPVTLAKFEVIRTDFPKRSKLSYLLQGIPENATQITYPYSLTQFIKRFDWEDTSKAKRHDKTFRQCCVNTEGEVIWEKGSDRWPCYRESEIITAKDWPLLQEGETCVDTARCTLGLVSTTLQGSNWGEEAITATLTRIKEAGVPGLVFITDNDDPGETKGKKVLTASAKIDFPVIVIPIMKLWEDAPDAGDLADWVKWGKANGMNTEDFIKRLEAEIHDAVNRRSQEIQPEKSELTKKPLDPEDLKIKVKAFIQEKDHAKREVMLYEFRQLGLGEKSVNRIAAQLTQNSTIPRTTRLNASEFRSRISGGKKWLIPGLISQVGTTLVTGPSGGGKSTFAFDLAGSVICGNSFMGESIKENGTVIFACSDEPTDESQERALLQGFFHSDNFEFLEQWNLGQMEILEEAIADRLPKLVVVDSFDSIHREAGYDENAIQASETIKQFNALSQKYSCAFIVLHHENKDPKLSGVNKSRGSTAIVASANAHIRIIGKDENPETKYVKIEKMRGAATRSILCSVDYHNVRFEPQVNLEFEQDKDGRIAIVNLLRNNPNQWFEVQELNQYLGWSGKGIYRYLKQLTDRGEVSRKPNPMGTKGMVYSIMCTDGNSPEINLIPPSLVKSVSQEKIISETLDIQLTEVSHNLVTTQSHLVTTQLHETVNEVPETLTLSDSHVCGEKGGDIEGGGATSQTVPIFESLETAPNIEPDKLQVAEFEQSKTEINFVFELGDRGRIGQIIKDKVSGLIAIIKSITKNDRYSCLCIDESLIAVPFEDALTDLDPDDF